MDRLLDSLAIVGVTSAAGEPVEVCATAVADYESPQEMLTVTLDCFLRPEDPARNESRIEVDWLPKRQIVREHVSRGQASDLAHDVMKSWRKRVANSIPAQGTGVQAGGV